MRLNAAPERRCFGIPGESGVQPTLSGQVV
jgi:hypothetical protein